MTMQEKLQERGYVNMAIIANKCGNKGINYVVDFNGENTRMVIQITPDRADVYYEKWGGKHFDSTIQNIEEIQYETI